MKKKRGVPDWGLSVRILLTSLVGSGVAAYADAPLGLVGGQLADGTGYAAFLSNTDGALSPISALPASTEIRSVGMSVSGTGLIGGQSNGSAYAALVQSDGTLSPLTLFGNAGNIVSVAINQTNLGLIVGRNISANDSYAAQVLPDGTVVPLAPISADPIDAVALNDSGVGLIGGEGSSLAYAAFISSSGTVTPVSGMPTSLAGEIFAVAINDLGQGIIGGRGLSNYSAFAAFVTPEGAFPTLLSPLPTNTFSSISSVAINQGGSGLIGGHDDTGMAYAGRVDPDGFVTSLIGASSTGDISSVALNDAGIGLIGGQVDLCLYAALVGTDGSLTSLFSGSTPGAIHSVALNRAGVGLLGGQAGTNAYLALVAPNGTLTPLSISNGATINSVVLSIGGGGLLEQTIPRSVGSSTSAISAQLAASSALHTRLIDQNRIWANASTSNTSGTAVAHNRMNLAYNETFPVHSDRDLALNPKTASTPLGTMPPSKANSIWLQPFGEFVRLKGQGTTPSLTNEVGGLLLGYDWQQSSYTIGMTLGYAFNYAHLAKGLGHGKIQEELASLYGVYYTDHLWVAAVFWGGLYQSTHVRHTLSQITSTGKTHGWILEPHLELASPWAIDQGGAYYVEPFVLFDWVNNWQHGYTESGSSGLNVQMPNIYNSLLQSEIGLRFYERFVFGWGDFCLEEKMSYVNQAPFGTQSVDTSFVGSPSTFPVAVASSHVQNLGSVQILGSFVPQNTSYPYGGFVFQTTAGSSYQSYFVSLFTGIDF